MPRIPFFSRLSSLALAAALTACAAPEPPAPDAAPRALAPLPLPDPQGENQRITAPPLMLRFGEGETALPLAHWPAEGAPRAILLALHGYGDYGASSFGRAATYWSKMGISTYAPDQRGFGRAPGFQIWPGEQTLTADAIALARTLAQTRPDLPLYLLGHSMGGAVALTAAAGGAPVDGLLLLAPAVWGGDSLGPLLRASAWTAALVAPDARWTGEGVVSIRPTDDWEMLTALSRDPLHYASPSGREFLGLIRLMDRAVAAAPQAALPTLVLLGRNEEVIDPGSVEALPAILPGPVDFAYVPNGWHMLLRDRGAPAVWDRVADWIAQQPRSAAGAARP